MVPDPDAAEDLLQETFIALWENRTALDPAKGASVKDYLKQSTRFIREHIHT